MVMLFLPLLLVPFVVSMVGRNTGEQRGRSGGRGVNSGLKWNRFGPRAKYILRNYIANKPDFLTWEAFKAKHPSWFITAENPGGYYLTSNMSRNYKALIKRFNQHFDPNDPFFESYPAGFLEEIGALSIPTRNPHGLDFVPGSDDREEEEGADNLPNQVPAAINPEEEEEEVEAEEPLNPGLEEQIAESINQLRNAHINDNNNETNMSVLGHTTFHAHHINTVGLGRDGVQNAMGVITWLGPGINLSSLQITVTERRHFRITAKGAPELSRATTVLPAEHIFMHNHNIWTAIRQATQLFLNTLPKNDTGNLKMEAVGDLPAPCTHDGVVHPEVLGLRLPEEADREDRLLLHEIPLEDQGGHSPAYVAIAFFLEDMGDQNMAPPPTIRRMRPGWRGGPGAGTPGRTGGGRGGRGGRGSPESPSRRRRREGDNDVSMGEQSPSGDTASGGPVPDAAASGGGIGRFFRYNS